MELHTCPRFDFKVSWTPNFTATVKLSRGGRANAPSVAVVVGGLIMLPSSRCLPVVLPYPAFASRGRRRGMLWQSASSPILMNATPPSTSGEVLLIDELRSELEDLQVEATQARDRYESARARFMRLVQIAEQLQQRAVLDLKLGNEGNARQLLVEKKKVMNAADISMRRSQLFEILSSKLREAISQKESQLLAALSAAPAKFTTGEQPTVRVIYPKEENDATFREGLEQELDKVLSLGINGHEKVENVSGLVQERRVDGENNNSSQVVQVEDGDSDGRASMSAVDAHRWGRLDSASKDVEKDVRNSQQGLEIDSLSVEIDSIISSDEEDTLETRSSASGPSLSECYSQSAQLDLIDPKVGETKGNTPDVVSQAGVSSNGETAYVPKVEARLLFEEYLLDIDSQVAVLESKIKNFSITADILLGRDADAKDAKVELMMDLLQQVQGLRTRILDGVNMSIGQPTET